MTLWPNVASLGILLRPHGRCFPTLVSTACAIGVWCFNRPWTIASSGQGQSVALIANVLRTGGSAFKSEMYFENWPKKALATCLTVGTQHATFCIGFEGLTDKHVALGSFLPVEFM